MIECGFGGAEGTGPFAERRRQNLHAMPAGTPLKLVELLREQAEEIIRRARDPAADDDRLGIEDIDEADQRTAERADGFGPDFGGLRIPRAVGFDKSERAGVVQA